MSNSKPTCGPLFLRCLETFTSKTDDKVCVFSAGHMTGQAEKIYLGACSALMVRPSPQYRSWCLFVATTLSAIYGLEVSVFERDEISDEIWLHTMESSGAISELQHLEVNSPGWHARRGLLCGIPDTDIDVYFHKRSGYREPCDNVDAGTNQHEGGSENWNDPDYMALG